MISVRDSTRLNVSLDEFLKKIVDPIWLVPPGDLLKFSRWCLSRLNLLENECRFCLAIQIREQRDNEKWTYPFRRNLCRTLDPDVVRLSIKFLQPTVLESDTNPRKFSKISCTRKTNLFMIEISSENESNQKGKHGLMCKKESFVGNCG